MNEPNINNTIVVEEKVEDSLINYHNYNDDDYIDDDK